MKKNGTLQIGLMAFSVCSASMLGCEADGGASSAPVAAKQEATAPAAATSVAAKRPAPRENFDEFDALPEMVIDGEFTDWADGVAFTSDWEHFYFRINMPDAVTPQNHREEIMILVDVDSSASTGVRTPIDGSKGLAGVAGVDFAVRFSPVDGTRHNGRGATAWVARADASGAVKPVEVGHAALGLVSAPTYRSASLEARVSRAKLVEQGIVGAGIDGSRVRWWVRMRDRAGQTIGFSEVVEGVAPRWVKASARATLPEKPRDTIRVLNYNVLLAAPMKTPEPFARILRALDPDVVLLQEWEKATEAEIAAWFNTHLSGSGDGWSCVRSEGWGVAVVSRHPLKPFGPRNLVRPADAPADARRADSQVRFAGALVETPVGDLAAASIHLKCCGSGEGPEERARQSEARVIGAAMLKALEDAPAPMRIIAGDFNLVGTREPLVILRRGLDADGTDLGVVPARVLTRDAKFTWTDAKSEFPPGRLDYFLFSDSTSEVVQSFVFDSAMLSDAALAATGVRREDSRSSDHLPVVVDMRAK